MDFNFEEELRERVDSGENHTESENDSTQCQSDECRRTSETSRVLFQKCRVTRHDTGRVHWRVAGVREQEVSDRNWRRGCDPEEEVVRAAQGRRGGQ